MPLPSPLQDVIFGGRITLNVPEQQVEYRKRVTAPNGTQVVFNGSCCYRDRRLVPNLGVQLEFGGATHSPEGHSNAVWVGNSFDVRQRFTIAKGLGVEVRVPPPCTLRVLARRAVGSGALPDRRAAPLLTRPPARHRRCAAAWACPPPPPATPTARAPCR